MPAPLRVGTGLAVTIDGVDITDQELRPLGNQSYLSGNQSKSFTLTNEGLDTITVASVSAATWGFNLAVAGIAFPVTLGPGQDATGTIGTYTWPLLGGPIAGVYLNRFTISFVEGESDTLTAWFEAACVLWDSASVVTVPTKPEFYDEFIFDQYFISNASVDAMNPLGLNNGMNDPVNGGHLGLLNRTMLDFASQGGKRVMWWQPWGQFQASGSIEFDAWIHAKEYGAAHSRNDIWDTFEEALDTAAGLGVTVMIYNGTTRDDQNFLQYEVGPLADPLDFFRRFIESIDWALRRDNVEIMLDVPFNESDLPENPLIQAGEPRFEMLSMLRELKEARSIATSVEPRGLAAQTWWHGAAGWSHVMLGGAYARANPSWFGDASTNTSDAQMSPKRVLLLNSDGSKELQPWQAARSIFSGFSACMSISALWMTDGDDLDDLYNQSVAILDVALGSEEV